MFVGSIGGVGMEGGVGVVVGVVVRVGVRLIMSVVVGVWSARAWRTFGWIFHVNIWFPAHS